MADVYWLGVRARNGSNIIMGYTTNDVIAEKFAQEITRSHLRTSRGFDETFYIPAPPDHTHMYHINGESKTGQNPQREYWSHIIEYTFDPADFVPGDYVCGYYYMKDLSGKILAPPQQASEYVEMSKNYDMYNAEDINPNMYVRGKNIAIINELPRKEFCEWSRILDELKTLRV